MEKINEEQLILSNLKDAGCDDILIKQFYKLKEKGHKEEMKRLLLTHRASLLDKVHTGQRMIDCLDYLIYNIGK